MEKLTVKWSKYWILRHDFCYYLARFARIDVKWDFKVIFNQYAWATLWQNHFSFPLLFFRKPRKTPFQFDFRALPFCKIRHFQTFILPKSFIIINIIIPNNCATQMKLGLEYDSLPWEPWVLNVVHNIMKWLGWKWHHFTILQTMPLLS